MNVWFPSISSKSSEFLFPETTNAALMENPSSFSSTETAAAVVGVLFFLYALSRALSARLFASQRKRLPPQVRGAWPIIGHLHLLGGSKPIHKTLADMADAYGPIFTLKLGVHTTLVVSSWEIARECFTTKDLILASRPKLVASELLGYDYAMFPFSPYGPYWRHVRKIVMLQLLSNHCLNLLQHIQRSEVGTWISKLYEFWVDGRRNGVEKVSVEMKARFGDVTLNTIFRMVVGRRFSTTFDDSDNEKFLTALREFFELFGVFVPSDSLPFLRWLDLGGHQKTMRKTAKVMDETLDKWLKENRQRRNSGEVETEGHDFMDVMLSSLKEDDEELSGYDVDTVTKATCLALILGGSDTTRVAMTWTLSLLLNNQEASKKVQLELDEQVGRERLVEESDVKNLLYLQAIVKEALRLYPPGPLSAFHEAMEDCTVNSYYIPMGTRMPVNIQKLQRDPLVWEDPCEFRPERFLTSQKDFDVIGQNPQLIPFGSGRRVCPGISFSIQLMQLTLANLLHGFEVCRPLDEPIDMEESIGLTSIKTTPLEVVLTPRLSSQVYE